jgi:hypothetical protein
VGAESVMRRTVASWLAAFAAVGLVACGSDGAAPPPGRSHGRTTAAFTAGGVRVTLSLGLGGQPTLIARFSPLKDGFHLYSAHLPVGGVDGLGQRTSLEPAGGLRAAGPLRMNAQVHKLRIKPLHVTLPVYPDGPVTARLAVHRTGTGTARVSVSYAACSDAVCYPPVRHHVADLG